jgi:thiamine phosphate synthase YjbQ (UPF0047 family)
MRKLCITFALIFALTSCAAIDTTNQTVDLTKVATTVSGITRSLTPVATAILTATNVDPEVKVVTQNVLVNVAENAGKLAADPAAAGAKSYLQAALIGVSALLGIAANLPLPDPYGVVVKALAAVVSGITAYVG